MNSLNYAVNTLVPSRFTQHPLRTYADSNFALFDDIFNGLFDPKTSNYPPYNAIMEDENNYTIEVALAGFSKDDIDVTLKNDNLLIASKTQESVNDYKKVASSKEGLLNNEVASSYPYHLHKGIAKRSFSLTFKIPKNANVHDPILKDGILTIKIEKVIKPEDKPKVFKIK